MMKNILVLAVILVFAASAAAQTSPVPIKLTVTYDTTDASSSAVVPLLIKQIAAQPKFFALVKAEDKDMFVIADCYRETPNDPYSCFYTAIKIQGPVQSFLGGAIVVKKTAEEAATALFASIVQDVAERWNSTQHRILVSELEACLLLTESSCAVPEPLVAELKVKTINLSQYMRKGALKP
jgi:hypothetical protein